MTTVFLDDCKSLAQIAAEARRLADDLDRLAVDGAPAPADLVGAPLLDGWWIGLADRPALRGRIVGDPAHRDGATLKTDDLVAMDYGAGWARTLTRWYAFNKGRSAS